MIKEKAMELVEALRSGQYSQGRDRLRHGDNFCCLGVACDLNPDTNWVKVSHMSHVYVPGEVGSPGVLSKSTKDLFGFFGVAGNRRDGRVIEIEYGEYDSLANANDAGVSFEEIANYIEKNWEDL